MTSAVIITGMHRSGTSLVASLLHRAGLHVGDRLLGPGPGNRQGYFEDLDFVEFQDDLLRRLGMTIFVSRRPDWTPEADQRQHAEALVRARCERPAWGWKDPRTSLFLDFWHDLVPDAQFVFVYRRASEVVDSLRRRRDPEVHRQYPGAVVLERLGVPRFLGRRALDAWCVYNEAMVDFVRQHGPNCHVIDSGTAASTIHSLVHRLQQAGVPLEAIEDVEDVIVPSLLVREVPAFIDRLCARDARVQALHAALEAMAIRGDTTGDEV